MKEKIIYETEYENIKIQVIDKKYVRHLRFGNTIRQASIKLKTPFRLQTKYVRDMVSIVDKKPNIKRVLALGLGAGTIPSHLFYRFPNLQIDVVDIIPELKQISHEYFFLPNHERVSIIIEDALEYVMNTDLKYDLIFIDVFNNTEIPKHLTSNKFYCRLNDILDKNGHAVFNTWISEASYQKYLKQLKNNFNKIEEVSVPKAGNHIAFCSKK